MAIDLGGTKTTGAVVDPQGKLRYSRTIATPAEHGPQAVIDAVTVLTEEAAAHETGQDRPPPRLVGVGSVGVIDSATGLVTSATNAIPGWAGTDLRGHLAASTGLDVHVLNDVHAHALGESRYGAARDTQTALLVAAGTGIGAAIVLNGDVVSGAHGAAGHAGHVPAPEATGLTCSCGAEGHLEAIASGPGLFRLYGRLVAKGLATTTMLTPVDARSVVAAGLAGDPAAAEAVHTAAHALGRAIGGWINVFDPDVVILTGGLSAAGDDWWRTVCHAAKAETIESTRRTRIAAPKVGPEAALLGAACFAAEQASGERRTRAFTPSSGRTE